MQCVPSAPLSARLIPSELPREHDGDQDDSDPAGPERSGGGRRATRSACTRYGRRSIRARSPERSPTGASRWSSRRRSSIYGLPWLYWNDRQAVLFDLAARKFYIFGLVFWPQDVIYLTVLLILSAFLAVPVHRGGRPRSGAAMPARRRSTPRSSSGSSARSRASGRRACGWMPMPHSLEKLVEEGAEAHGVDRARGLDRLHVRRLLHADPRPGRPRDPVGPGRLGGVLDRVLRARHLRQRRLDARAGLQVHVPLRAFPVGDVRPRHAGHRLRPRARRAARFAQQEDRRRRPPDWGTASTAASACRCARPASTSARASSTSASAAPRASTAATR